MRCQLLQVAAFLVFLGSTGRAAAEPLAPRVALCPSVAVRGNRILLSDLLPAAAPAALRLRSSHLVLGRAPQPGSLRAITRAQIEQQLDQAPGLSARLSIPEQVVVKRVQRPLSAEEILRAIRSALESYQPLEERALQPADLHLQAPVLVTVKDPGLRVLGIEFDRWRRETRFRLWTAHEPQLLPFYVSIGQRLATLGSGGKAESRAGELAGTAGLGGSTQVTVTDQGPASPPFAAEKSGDPRLTRAHEIKRPERVRPAVLALPGKPSTLVTERHGVRIATKVVPLQRGVKGQQILVRSLGTRRVLKAEVVTADLLRANF